jgi:serine/threonine protein kinase
MTTAPKRQPIPFGSYLLLDRLHIGGLSELWRAKTFGAGGLERLVAIRRLLPNLAEDHGSITAFVEKARCGVQLSHANITQVYELGQLANSYFMAAEYVSGRDLRALFDRCRQRGAPAPIPMSCYAMAQCCEGLDHAHGARDKQGRELNVVHRELTPHHVLISYEGEVKVTDFGGAAPPGLVKGPAGYDRRSDVFAAGVCLYELLAGERLGAAAAVPPPSHFNANVPVALERIVLKALARDVNARYQHARELAEDLRKFMSVSGQAVARAQFARFTTSVFAEDSARERQRLDEYAAIKAPSAVVDLLN